MESPDDLEQDAEPVKSGLAWFGWNAAALFGGFVLVTTDDNYIREMHVHDLGDGSDSIIYPGMWITLLVVWGAQVALTRPTHNHLPALAIRGIPFFSWLPPIPFLILYLVVFRPRG